MPSVLAAIGFAVVANLASSAWAEHPQRLSGWLWATLVLAPLVFLSFGYVASRIGLARAAGVIDTLVMVCTMLMGLIFFGEWERLSAVQLIGAALAILGVALMAFAARPA